MGAKIPTDYPQIFWRISLGILSINKPKVHRGCSITHLKGRILSDHILMNKSPYRSPLCVSGTRISSLRFWFYEILCILVWIRVSNSKLEDWEWISPPDAEAPSWFRTISLYRTRAALVLHIDGQAGLYSLSPLPSLTACLSPKRFKSLRLSTWPSWSPPGIC